MARRLLIMIAILLGLAVTAIVSGAGFLLLTSRGAELVLRKTIDHFNVAVVSWQRIEGNLLSGVSIHDLELTSSYRLPSGTVIRAQELYAKASGLTINSVMVKVINARVFLPGGDPVVINGVIEQGALIANVYTRSFDLIQLKDLVPNFKYLQAVRGDLRDIDLQINGRVLDMHVQGQATVNRWKLGNYTLLDVPCEIDLGMSRPTDSWKFYGKIRASSGTALSTYAKIQMLPSHILFDGVPRRPQLDLHGQTRLTRTRIDIVIRGTREDPQVILTSEPSLPQEQLLLMLTTGRHWKGFTRTVDEQKMAPELAVDFVDYFLFGGTGKKVLQLLGFSDFSIRMGDSSQGVTISRDITDRIGLGYDAEIFNDADGVRHGVKQTVSGEYDLTDRMIIGVQKEMVPAAGQSAGSDPLPIADDRIFLRYKKNF